MPGIVETLLEVAKTLFGLRTTLSEARRTRKDRVADFISAIAQTIETTSASLKQAIYPHGQCEELLAHSNNMERAVGDLVGRKQAQALANKLKEIWEIEQLFSELQGKPERARNKKLERLDEAAGLFRATAAFVRVSP